MIRGRASGTPDGPGRPWGATLAALVFLLSACSGGGGAGERSLGDYHRTALRAGDFVDPTSTANRFYPLRPGMQWVRAGTTVVGSRKVPHQVISTMTDVVRTIHGVPAIAMLDQDIDAGQIAEESIDYLALDTSDNVWLMGSYTAQYSGGRFTNSADAWLGGSAGGEAGILLPADPGRSTPPWVIGLEKEGQGTAGQVVESGTHTCVKFACYDGVLVVREGEIGNLDNEFKYYAPDVGQILNTPRRDGRGADVEELVNLTDLSPTGLAEASTEVQQLEGHARETAPDLFAARSTRTS